MLRPSLVVLFFSSGLGDGFYQKLRCEFGAANVELEPLCYHELELEEEWTDVVLDRVFPDACAVRIQVGEDGIELEKDIHENRIGGPVSCNNCCEHSDYDPGLSLCSLVARIKCWCCSSEKEAELEFGPMNQTWSGVEAKLVNFDTAALVTIASGISNQGTEKLLATPELQLIDWFKGNYDFVIVQVDLENHNPIHRDLLGLISGKRRIICESVRSEFQEHITMCGGPNEKLRAEFFLKFLKVAPDCPSTRLTSLPTTRKLALKNKVVFGTGDYWCAPTVTANWLLSGQSHRQECLFP